MQPVFWIEGNIGSSKTTLTRLLAERMNLRPIYEPVGTNPYLDLFYKDMKTWAWTMQMHLMGVRFGLQKLAVSETLVGEIWRGAVLDRGLPGDRVFCKLLMQSGMIHPLQWQTYQMWYDIMAADLRPPSVIIYLDVEPEICLKRIRKRGRECEADITLDYLEKVQAGYLDLLAEIKSGEHAWSRGMETLRQPCNADTPPIDDLVEKLEKRFY